MSSDSSDKNKNLNPDIDLDSLDSSKYLDNPVINNIYKERSRGLSSVCPPYADTLNEKFSEQHKGEVMDFDKLMDSAKRLSKSTAFNNVFFLTEE